MTAPGIGGILNAVTFRMRWLAALVLGVWLILVLQRPAAASTPVSLIVSNLNDTAFAVSWLTASNETAQVQVIGGRTYNDDRGVTFTGATHYITISGLVPNTAYQFDVVSGSIKYDNGGAHYTVKTGTTLAPPMPDLIVGRVRNPDGSPALDTIVLFTVQQETTVSAPLSMLVTARDNGLFHINVSDARTLGDPTHYFPFGAATDSLTIQAANANGNGELRVPMDDSRLRAPDPSQTVIIALTTGAQTPTLIVRQPTPTPIPRFSPQAAGGFVVGVGTVIVILIGIVVVAILFIWRR